MLAILILSACRGPGTEPEPSDSATPNDSTAPDDTSTPPDDTSTPPDDTGTPDDCAGAGSPGLAAAPVLSASALLAAAAPEAPLDNAAFREPEGADDPLHTFAGRLQVSPGAGARVVYHAEYWLDTLEQNAPLPDIDAEYVQCGRDLLPVIRGRQITDDIQWDLLLSPGRIWSVPDDDGLSRASLPFTLSFKAINCTFNGLMTFLFDGSSTSQVRWQITQETCHMFQLDAWGQAEGGYADGASDAAEGALADFLIERQSRPTVRAFEQLATDHPDIDLAVFDTDLSLPDLSARGLLVDDVLYLDSCRTRTGDHPYCEDLILPSFSLAKTAYTGLGLAAMAQEFPTDPYARTLGELLGASGTWSGVTVENLVDMSSGHYLYDNQYDIDVPGFYDSLDLSGRLAATYALPAQSEPGEKVVYLTPNSQVAAAAMDAHLVDVGADITDSFDYVVERVLRPAGVSPDSFTSLRTWDGGANQGTGFGGYGMWFTPHGITSLGAFLQRGGDGWLHPDRLAETMLQTDDLGPQMSYYSYRYNNGVWGYPLSDCDKWVPIMFGVSGITVLMPPSGLVFFAFTDSQQYTVYSSLSQLEQIRSSCE